MREINKPVFLWGKEDGEVYKGSCRSPGPSVVDIMLACPEGTFVEAGGHAMSGGFAIADEAVFDIRERINAAYTELEKTKGDLTSADQILTIDARLPLASVNKKTWNALATCAPFGEGYSKPLFIFENVTVEAIKPFGKTKEHIELTLSDGSAKNIKAIQFFAHDNPAILKLTPWSQVSIIGHLEESRFKSYPEYRIKIVEII
jgi:single-stranded-DNA-specific exonuclease